MKNTVQVLVLRGNSSLIVEEHGKTFLANRFYKSTKGKKGLQVDNIPMDKKLVNNMFEPAIDRIRRDWEELGITVEGKLVSKTAFNKLPRVITLANGNSYIKNAYFGDPQKVMYVFEPMWSGMDKATSLKDYYCFARDILLGDEDFLHDGVYDCTLVYLKTGGYPVLTK